MLLMLQLLAVPGRNAAARLKSAQSVPAASMASFLHQRGNITSTRTGRGAPPIDSEQAIASPGVVAWRARRLLAFLLILTLALIGLTIVARQADPNSIDLGATRWIQQLQNPTFAALMVWASWPGFAPQTWVMPFLVAAPFAVRRLWVEALWVVATQATSLLVTGLKDVVHRPRPSPDVVSVLASLDSPSFPSGHVVQYTMLFGLTFFLVYVLARRSMLRTVGLVLLAIPIALVGPSRLYLGQHWLSDVLGGYTVAAMLLLPVCWAYVRWRLEGTRGRLARRTNVSASSALGVANTAQTYRPGHASDTRSVPELSYQSDGATSPRLSCGE